MASLTPGVLSKLLETSGKVTSSSPHRSPLLQVVEIFPCLAGDGRGDRLRGDGFFLRVSDSLHAAYVAVSGADADLIRSDEIRLGQLVYVRGGVHAGMDCPVPVIRGLKPASTKGRPRLGNPSDLVLINVFDESFVGSSKKRKDEPLKTDSRRRLSLDSARRAWDQAPTKLTNCSLRSSPRLKTKQVFADKKASPKKDSPSKHPISGTSPFKTKNGSISPISAIKPLKDDVNSLSKKEVSKNFNSLVKAPANFKSWSDQRILWNALPSSIHGLGRGVLSHRNASFLAAACALEEASATEAVLHCLQAFGELCESSQKLSVGQVVQRLLDVHQSMQRVATAFHSLLSARFPGSGSSNHSSTQTQNLSSCKSISDMNAASWVQAAVKSNLSTFSLLEDPEKDGTPSRKKHHYVVIENFLKGTKSENQQSKHKTSPRNPADKGMQSPTKQLSPANKVNTENKSGLKEAASLADELLVVSQQWFLKYLEDSLKTGFAPFSGKGVAEPACLMAQLKRVNQWLDDLVGSGLDTDEKIEDTRKKLHRFLLENIDFSVAITQPHNSN